MRKPPMRVIHGFPPANLDETHEELDGGLAEVRLRQERLTSHGVPILSYIPNEFFWGNRRFFVERWALELVQDWYDLIWPHSSWPRDDSELDRVIAYVQYTQEFQFAELAIAQLRLGGRVAVLELLHEVRDLAVRCSGHMKTKSLSAR